MKNAAEQIQNNRLKAFRALNLPASQSRAVYVRLMVRDYTNASDDSVRAAIIEQIKDDGMSYCFAKRDGQLIAKVTAA